MSNQVPALEINTLDQAILTEIAKLPLTGYNLMKLLPINTGWSASHQQIYRQCSKLEQSGFLEYREILNDGKPDSKEYRLTEKGKDVLREALEKEQFKLVTFRNKSTVMLAAGAVSYFVAATDVLGRAIQALHKKLDGVECPIQRLNLELEIEHKKADLSFAGRAKELLSVR